MSRPWYDARNVAEVPKYWNAWLLASALCVAVFLVQILFFRFDPGSGLGLLYGTLATLFMIGAALLGVRRRMMARASKQRLGSSHAWLQFHLYGGALAMLLVLMHCGFRIPTGSQNWWLWALSLWVTASGVFGVLLQKVIPRMLASGLEIEVVYERIPELVRQLREKAEAVIADSTPPVKDYYFKNLAPSLIAPEARLVYYVDITGGIQSRVRQFSYLRNVLSAGEQAALDTLELLYKTKLELDAHFTLQKALRWWLYLHVPVSLVLLALVGLHLFAVIYY
jgi:hypothetical protein